MFENPSNFYLWCVSGISVLVAFDTVMRMWTERHRLPKDDLNEDDRAMIWRIVLFIVFPLITLMELKATIAGVNNFGGTVDKFSYGLLWYEVSPEALTTTNLIPALFSGEFIILLMAICMLPSLLFRPHPFLATLTGYTVSFIFFVSLIVEPVLALVGVSGSKWSLAFALGAQEQIVPLLVVHACLAVAYLMIIQNKSIRLWFSELTRPEASDRLKSAIFELRKNKNSAMVNCKLGILYEKAGLTDQAKAHLKLLLSKHKGSIYTYFLNGLLAYKSRKFDKAKSIFLYASDLDGLSSELRSHMLGAAACASFAQGEITQSINLSERALDENESYLVARMVKVDALLKMGKKDSAAQEILIAVHSGLTLDLEDKIPLDIDLTFPLMEHVNADAKQDSKFFEVISKN